jgi:Uma2 family endonuclease
VRAPDIGFVKAARMPTEHLREKYFEGAPDLVVETVSPYDSASGVQDKVQSWLLHGSQSVWVVEPKTQTVTVYRADGSAQVLQRTDSLDGESVLPGFQLELTRLFREKSNKMTG